MASTVYIIMAVWITPAGRINRYVYQFWAIVKGNIAFVFAIMQDVHI